MKLFTFFSSVLLLMLKVPNDIALHPIHMVKLEIGGLRFESGCVKGNYKWPAHTIAHQSKWDHDYTNWAGIAIQLPLFLLVDIGCTAINVAMWVQIGQTPNLTAMLQVLLCGTNAIINIHKAIARYRLRRELLRLWLRIACDPRMDKGRRRNARTKYIAEGGNKSNLNNLSD